MRTLFSSVTRRLLDVQSAGWLLGFCAVWLLATAGIRPLMLPDEGRYVGITWEMLSSGNWLVPTLDGLPFFHKPPLFYWLTTLGLQVFGATEWAGRIASTTSAILACAAIFAFVRKYFDRATANLTVIVLVTQPFFYAGAQFANLDMLVASMISVSIVAGADAALSLERSLPYRTALTVSYLFAVLGVLAKGLIGFVLPGAILFFWLVIRKKYRLIPAMLPLHLIVLFFVLVSPWFLWMEMSFKGFWDYFFIYHHFRRFTEAGFNNQVPFWFYLPVLLLLTLPWSPWIFRAATPGFLKDPEKSAVRSLMVLWTLGILIFFSLPKSKLVGYILPALPAFAGLIADLIRRWLRDSKKENAYAWIGVSIIGAGVACLAIILGVARHENSIGLRPFAATSSHPFPPGDQIVMLDEYQYDMPFYLHAEKNPWIISDWKPQAIPKGDHWKKELYDAGQFNPAKMRDTLISVGEFSSRLCASPEHVFWIWGKKSLASRYAFLDERMVVYSDANKSVWRLDEQGRQRLRLCGGKPSSG